MRRIAATICVLAISAAAWGEDAQWRPSGEHVLVVYNANSPDDAAAAEYYATRRGVPKTNLLGLKLDGKLRQWNYKQFFEQILTPTAERLAGARGGDISYLVTCPGLPMTIDTGHRPPAKEDKRNWFVRTSRRATDQFLICIEANKAAGVGTGTSIDRKTGKATQIPAAGPGRAGILGGHMRELVLPLYGQYAHSETARHVRQLRKDDPDRMGFRLVSRLGLGLDSARDSVDRALYAERFLRLPEEKDSAPLRPEIWLDMKYQFARDHVSAMKVVVPMVRGAKGSPFSAKSGLLMPWPVVIDNVPTEIGAGNPAHKPQVTATISSVQEDGITLTPPRKTARTQPDAPAAFYFVKGWKLTTYTSKPKSTTTQPAAPAPAPETPRPVATITGVDMENNRLILSSTKGFAGGDKVRSEWPGTFPADNCVFFYGFYGLGQFEDCRKFPPGAMGVHVDSSCLRWARGAIDRGITTTWGVVTEPLSAGIPYGHLLLAGLTQGYDWGESTYAATRLSQRWAGVCLGDPLYAPFRSLERVDKAAPVIGPVTAKANRKGTIITAALAGESEDELVDVALFKLEYGPTGRYGKAVDFFDWPNPADGKNVKGRRFGYSRHFKAALADLSKGKPVHYRLTARDPAGLKSMRTGTFTP